MPLDARGTRLTELLEPFGQTHVLRFRNDLPPAEWEILAAQIESLDLAELARLTATARQGAETDWREIALRCEVPPAVRLTDRAEVFADPDFRRVGEALLAEGKVAVVLVAGGQATRLGSADPKGLYPIGPVSGDSLFRILFEMVKAKRKRYGAALPIYVMTSDATHAATARFLAEHHRFGLPEADVTLFRQGMMPIVDAATGKLLLAEHGRLALAPDGHGGVLAALERNGCFADMRRRGIERIFFLQVDNPLVEMCHEEMLGLLELERCDLVTKVIAKLTPDEKLGAVVQLDGRLMILEYSDLPPDLADRRDSAGLPVFWAGSIAVHAFRRDFLERKAGGAEALPFHFALKKTPYIDERGVRVVPTVENSLKFERFIFDVFPDAVRGLVLETDRETEYAAVKNATGDFSPDEVRDQMMRYHRRRLQAAGYAIEAHRPVEIGPLHPLHPGNPLPHGLHAPYDPRRYAGHGPLLLRSEDD